MIEKHLDDRNPDLARDPDSPYGAAPYEYEHRSLWAAVAVLILLVGGLIVAAVYSSPP